MAAAPEFYRDAQGRELHYIEVNADIPIPAEKDATTVGFTLDSWLAHNQRKPIDAYVDDHHNHTPVGEVLHTFEARDPENPAVPMLGAGAFIHRHTPKGRELSEGVLSGKIKHVSIDYRTSVDPLTNRKLGQKLVAIGLHTNPHNRKCIITRQRGADGADGQGADLYEQLEPGRIAAQHHPTSYATKVEDVLAALRTTSRMAESAPAAAVVPPAAAAVPPSQPAAPAAAAAAAAVPPAQQKQPDAPVDVDMKDVDASVRAKVQERIKALSAMKPEQMMVEAAKSALLEERLNELRKLNEEKESKLSVYLTREQEAQKKQFEERMAEITKLAEPLKALGYDLADADVKKVFEEHARDTAKPNKIVAGIINNAKAHQEAQAKAAEAAERAKQEAVERNALASVYGWDRVQRAEKAQKQDATATPAVAAVAAPQVPQAASAAQLAAPASVPAAAAGTAVPASQQSVTPLFQQPMGPLAALRSEIDASFAGLARAQADMYSERIKALRSEDRLGSVGAKKFELLQANRTPAAVTVQQGADGGLFTGQLLNVQAPVQAYEVVSDLATSGRWRDLNAAAVLACDGQKFRNPYTQVEFSMQEILDPEYTRRSSQVWTPDVAMACAANLLSAGLGERVPCVNRDRIEEYSQHVPTRKVPGRV